MRKKVPIIRNLMWCLLLWVWATPAQAQPMALLSNETQDTVVPHQQKSLGAILSDLEGKYQVSFNYASDVVKNKVVKLSKTDQQKSLEETLDQLLSPLGLKYEKLKDGLFFIEEKDKVEKLERKAVVPGNSSVQYHTGEAKKVNFTYQQLPATLVQMEKNHQWANNRRK